MDEGKDEIRERKNKKREIENRDEDKRREKDTRTHTHTDERDASQIKSTIFVTSSAVGHARMNFGDFPCTAKHVRRVGRRHYCSRTQHYISLRNARHYRVVTAARASTTDTNHNSQEEPLRLPTSMHPLPLVK